MGWFRRARHTAIGVDLGGRSIKAVQLIGSGSQWRLNGAVAIQLPVQNHPLDVNAVRELRQVLHRQGFVGDDIVLAAPMKQLVVDVLELPPRTSGAPVEQIARMEMARAAKLENTPFELECWDLPAPARPMATTSVMAVAFRHADADALLDPFETEGFNVIALDARCWALARASASRDATDAITAILDLGWNQALLCLVRNGQVVYQRTLSDCGLGILVHGLTNEFDLAEEEVEYVLQNVGAGGADSTQITDIANAKRIRELIVRHIDAMVTEMSAAFEYAIHRYAQTPIKSLMLVGGGSNIAGMCELLSSRLGAETKILSPAGIVQCPAPLLQRCGDGIFTAALGLSWFGKK